MQKKKIYVAGCGGMLGEAFYKELKDVYDLKCTDKDVNDSWLHYLDFTDFEAYKEDVNSYRPDYLFHIGAITDLEYCEQNPSEAYLTNTTGVENAVYIANSLDIPILYISTAGIFDGSKEVFDDWDTPNPLSVYARSKFMGERFVIENARTYLICRAGWMMGGGPKKDKKFIQKLMKQIKNGSRELFVVNDKDGTPTYTYDFVRTVMALVVNGYWGLYNCVCKGQTSRLEVANELVSILCMADKITIRGVTSDYFKHEYFATRPPSERLVTKKLDLRRINLMRDWKVALKEYIETSYENYIVS